ncbi:LSU ribosomal protein L29p (L35e) [hydrothermal vent metagenome]|uniref:LSU ribosomal protein L29p (L35e) n=1 Tax=hydrothermal vent metagenome TaxID=652676 RepID=A0A3B1C0X2_9ZZZZ
MKFEKFRDMSGDELDRKLEDLKVAYMKLRFQHATAQLDSPAKLKNTRRDIAKAMTLINQRKAEAAKETTEI